MPSPFACTLPLIVLLPLLTPPTVISVPLFELMLILPAPPTPDVLPLAVTFPFTETLPPVILTEPPAPPEVAPPLAVTAPATERLPVAESVTEPPLPLAAPFTEIPRLLKLRLPLLVTMPVPLACPALRVKVPPFPPPGPAPTKILGELFKFCTVRLAPACTFTLPPLPEMLPPVAESVRLTAPAPVIPRMRLCSVKLPEPFCVSTLSKPPLPVLPPLAERIKAAPLAGAAPV